jgi:predicted nucleic acid-binding protein
MSDEIPSYVLDSFSLISHFQIEGGHGRVVELFEQAQKEKCRLFLSLINLGEVCYIVERRRGMKAVHKTLAAIESLPVDLLPVDKTAVLEAAHLKAQYSISYADAFTAAAAIAHSAVLVTGDPEFKTLTNIIQLELLTP